MDGWFYFKIFWAALSLIILGTTSIILWRMRGILSWKRSLKSELEELKKNAEKAKSPRKESIQIVESRCRKIFHSFSPEIGEVRDITGYFISIAACFHPQSDRPELQITISHFLQSLEKSLGRFDRILQRRGFKKLQSINIRNIKSARRWYLRISKSFLYKWYFHYQKKIQRFSQLRLFLLPDPFVWLAYLSYHLTLLIFIKYLMVDLYLFFGKLAVEAYDNERTPIQGEGEEELQKTLEELESLEDKEEPHMDPQIKEIRNRFVGFPSMMTSNPTFIEWKNAVHEAAGYISKKYFPESDSPLEEAALGPLLENARSWIATFGKGKEFPVLRRFYQTRLDTLYRVKSLSDIILPKPLRIFADKALKTYAWLKWPMKVYRSAKKGSPWKIAIEVGWTVSKKASLVYIYGKTFDKACKELERVYYQSRELTNAKKAGFLT